MLSISVDFPDEANPTIYIEKFFAGSGLAGI
jgi:hypothetical protein